MLQTCQITHSSTVGIFQTAALTIWMFYIAACPQLESILSVLSRVAHLPPALNRLLEQFLNL